MDVVVYNHANDSEQTLSGSPEVVEQELLRLFPWLRSELPEHQGNLPALVEHLNSAQMYEAEIVDYGPDLQKSEQPRNLSLEAQHHHVIQAMLGYHHKLMTALDAARFLAGAAPAAASENVRQALWDADGDAEAAALVSHGLEASQRNRRALRAVQSIAKAAKAHPDAVQAKVQPGVTDASETADALQRAVDDRFVLPIALGGKHSQGSLLARDESSGRTWLLKPGSGGPGPAAGAKDDPATQSRREACFWHVADKWGLGEWIPRADLVLVNGREYAAIDLLPWTYKTLDTLMDEDPNAGRTVLQPLLGPGVLHQWGALDFVLGNPDRHANNLMVEGAKVRLIDHGSAMAGARFDPAHDQDSFTPYYLRAWAVGAFSKLPPKAKLQAMPRLPEESEQKLRTWFDGLHADDLEHELLLYGVDLAPAVQRLAQLKTMLTEMPADLAVNRVWVEV
jgi:hypothetical protein